MTPKTPRALPAAVVATLVLASAWLVSSVKAAGDPIPVIPIETEIKVGPSPFGDPLPAADGSGRQTWFERQRPNLTSSQPVDRKPRLGSAIFFPPAPPHVAGAVPDLASPALFQGHTLSAPPRLTEYVGETFYPALGTRLFDGSLSAKLENRLAAYRQTRNELVGELTRQLHALATARAAAREQALRSFAATQTPRLTALEADAEQIRKALLHRGLFEASIDWNSSRRWKLGDRSIPGALAAEAEFQVLRAAAFEQDGLSVAQRGLLRELTLERRQGLRAETSTSPERGMFFSPETAWLSLPATLSPELTAKLAAYRQNRNELKQQLRKTIVELDAAPEAIRAKTLAVLADRQQRLLAALELRADELRRSLAALPEFSISVPRVTLPPDLAQRISALHRERLALSLERSEAVGSIGNPEPPFFQQPIDAWNELAWQKPKIDERSRLIENATKAFAQKNRERYTALDQLAESIRSELTQLARQQSSSSSEPLDADALLRDFEAAESSGPLTYHLALLQPGLSPEQRRLLFNAAQIELAPPLPPGEIKPTFPPPVPPS